MDNQKGLILIGVLLFLMSTLTVGLWVEYRFFCQQSRRLIELQKEYRMYVSVLKRLGNTISPVPVQHHNTGEQVCTDKEQFLIVNRERNYLHESAQEYLMQHNLVETLLKKTDKKKQNSELISRVQSSKLQSTNHPQRTVLRKSKSTSAFIWPISRGQFWLSSGFGPRKQWGFHYGVDMAALKGTPVYAVAAGTIIEARYMPGFGKTILLAHDDKRYKTRYAHLDSMRVKIGKKIKQGADIGTVGSTGYIRKMGKDGSHLHFEVYDYNKRINPLHVLPS